MRKNRPINLNLLTIHFPVPAIVSILHRVSGVILFILIPVMLCGLSYSLTLSGFDAIQGFLGSHIGKFIIWLLLMPFCYHLVAGIRHLVMDVGVGVSLKGGRFSSWLVFACSIILIILAGVWIW